MRGATVKVFVELVPVFGPYRDHHDMTFVKVAHPIITIVFPCGCSRRGIARDLPSTCHWHARKP